MTTAAARSAAPLRRSLGLAAVSALVVGDMLGSGIFFTPGELAAVAQHPWQVYFIWSLAGAITLCGALTLAELCTLLPRAGASYHAIRDGFGPFWGFLQVWIQLWVGGPGSVAGVAIALGNFLSRAVGVLPPFTPIVWGTAGIAFFVLINIAGVQWGGRTQIALTVIKILGIGGLVVGGLALAAPLAPVVDPVAAATPPAAGGFEGFVRFTGLGIAAVLYTYDGWIDVSHVAGEVRDPRRDFPRGLGIGVAVLTVVYLVVNMAFLRVLPLSAMRQAPTAVAANVATAAYGPVGGMLLNVLMTAAILGSLGGLVMTVPRLFYTLAADEAASARGVPRHFFRFLSSVSSRGVPVGATLFAGLSSIAALLFFGSFSRLANFLVVPMQLTNILLVASVFRLRARAANASAFLTPGYPITPLVYIVVLSGLLISAMIYQPVDTLIGLGLSATAVPFYLWLRRGQK